MIIDREHTTFVCDACGRTLAVDLTDDPVDGLYDIGDDRDLCGACFDKLHTQHEEDGE